MDTQSTNLNEIVDIIKPVFVDTLEYKNETSIEMKQKVGEMLCGDQWAFFIPIPEGLSLQSTRTIRNEEVDSCEALNQKLAESTLGKLAWKMVAPFLKGHILYTPNDEFTMNIIQKVNLFSFFLVHVCHLFTSSILFIQI